VREATNDEVKDLREEKVGLKETLAELFMENRVLKKTCSGMARTVYEILGL
jgi:transposase